VKGRVTLEGGAALERKLKALDDKVSKKIVTKALRAGAKIILTAAKTAAPKRLGLLKKSLKVRAAKRKKGNIRFVVQTAYGDFKGETFYSAFLEYGHLAGSRKLESRQPVPAQPFLGPAFESKKDEAAQAITAVIRQGILDAK
jgi:HK97 gp10 family phage protein